MPQERFEPTIPVFVKTKTVHALDRAAIVIGIFFLSLSLLHSLIRDIEYY
jgi:hypothetical protein